MQIKTGERAVPWVLLLAGLLFYVMRVTNWFTATPGDLGDARFNSVVLEHLFQWVTGDADSLWNPSFFYPAQGVLAFSDTHFGSGAVYILFRFMGLDREHAFNGWFVAGYVLNFVSLYVVMRKLDFSPVASGVAAFIYTFSLPSMAQESHAQLGWRFAIPPACLSLLQFVRERRMVRLAQLAGWGALQFFCSIYLGVFVSYLLAAMAVAMVVFPTLRPSPAEPGSRAPAFVFSWPALIAILLFAAATGWLLLRHHAVSKGYGFTRSPAEVMAMLPRLRSYLLADGAPAYRWLGSALRPLPLRHEHQLFLGFVPIFLSIAAFAMARTDPTEPRRWLLKLSLASLALLVVCTLSVSGRSLYQIAMLLPGVGSIRAVSRIILVMTLPVAVMAAIGTEKLLKRPGTRWLVTGLLIAALSLETLAYQPVGAKIDQWRSRMAPLETAAQGVNFKPDSVLYVSGRAEDPFYLTELDGMIFAQDRKIATLNGYSGYAPPGYVQASPCVSAAVRILGMSDTVLAPRKLSPEALLERSVWLQGDKCAIVHPPTDAATSPPDEEQAKNIQLSATTSDAGPAMLLANVRIQNNGAAPLHTLSRAGHSLRLAWRFVPQSKKTALDVGWGPWQHLNLSLPPGAHEDLVYAVPKPTDADVGPYELQVTLIAEDYRWLHDLKMPIGRTAVPAP